MFIILRKMPNGAYLYKEKNQVGGYRYISDAIGGGAEILDTSLTTPEEVEACLNDWKKRPFDHEKTMRELLEWCFAHVKAEYREDEAYLHAQEFIAKLYEEDEA